MPYVYVFIFEYVINDYNCNAYVNICIYMYTDPYVEDPIAGAGDELMRDLLQLLIPGKHCDDTVGGWQPKLLLQCAKVVNPF